MLIVGWTLAILSSSALALLVIICRKELAAHFKAAFGGYDVDIEQLEGDMRNAVKDINFRSGR
jgi:hypothetical protein